MREVAIIDRKLSRLLEDLGGSTALGDGLLKRAVALVDFARRANIRQSIAAAMQAHGDVLLALNRATEAAKVLKQALRELGPGAEPYERVPLLAKLAEAQGRCADWPAVIKTSGTGISLVEAARRGIGQAYAQSSFLRFSIALYRLGVRAAHELNDFDQMLTWGELSKCRSALRYLLKLKTPQPELNEAQREMRVLSDALHSTGDPVERDRLRAERQDRWEYVHAQLYTRTVPTPPAYLIEELQQSLQPDEAVLSYYWVGREELLITALDNSQFDSVLRCIGPWRAELDEFADGVLKPARGLELKLNEVVSFSGLLLPRQFCKILARKRRLLCSPHGILHAVPLHALNWEGKRLIEHLAVKYVPNLVSLLYQWQPHTTGGVLVAGVSEYPAKPTLAAAESECQRIAALYRERKSPVTLMTATEATRHAIALLDRDNVLAGYRCLHLAVHGENISSAKPMESHLSLRDTDIDGLEISNWRLNADLVVLSACCSGQRPAYNRSLTEELAGDDLFGLQAAFMAAGARQIVSALWPVRDDAAAAIMYAFHRHLGESFDSPELALQRAILEYRRRTTPVYDWAPFFVVGLGRPGSGDSN